MLAAVAIDASPYGTIYSSNITPDPETGIGKWSEEAFRRAMHEGVDREGRHLYPAFPYDHFTHATDQDLHALYAFLMSQQAVRSTVPSNDLKFPFNIRLLVAGWKILFLSQGSLEPDSSQSPEWNRGRYLVEGLGHCGSCHTPRICSGAEKKNSAYAGAVVEGWYGPSLNSSIFAAHKWSADQLAEYLSTGWHKMHGAAAGPMADVAKNLSQASRENVHAMAIYIASLSNDSKSPTAPAQDKPVVNATSEVVAIYTGACAKCHNDRNDVGPSKALPLSLSTAVHQARFRKHGAYYPLRHPSLSRQWRALYARIRRDFNRQSDRFSRRIFVPAIPKGRNGPTSTKKSRKHATREASHDDLSKGQWQVAGSRCLTFRRRCFTFCGTMSD